MATLLATEVQASTSFYFYLVAIAAFSFFVTLVAGVLAFKTLTKRREEKLQVILTTSWFAAGVFLGTALCDLLSQSDIFFHAMGFCYPLAFVFSCTGYGLSMFIDCLVERAVKKLITRECFGNSQLKSIDKIIIVLVQDIQPTKCCNATLPVGTSKSETKDCCIGHLRCVAIYRATLVIDLFFLLYPLMFLSMLGGGKIWSANTKTISSKAILNATSHNVIYIISLVFTVLRSIGSIPFVESLFIMVVFSIISPLGIMVELISSNINESLIGTVFGGEAFNCWVGGIVMGLFSGTLMYISVHHLLADDNYEPDQRSVSGTRFGKFVAMVAGVAVIALLKVLAI